MKITTLIVAVLGLTGAPALWAQGCCGGSAAGASCPMPGMDGHAAAASHEGHGAVQVASASKTPGAKAGLAQPVQVVFDRYVQVQKALAQDSLEGVATAATAMTKAIRVESKPGLPPKVSREVDALAKAQDLASARAAFKSLSESLIQYLKDQKVPAGTYHEAYCPMAKASWLQTDKTLANPYLGKEMIGCGEFKS